MQKRSHILLSRALLQLSPAPKRRRDRWAFLVGSFQPDCNPLTYLRGSRRGRRFGGHRFFNAQPFIARCIQHLQKRQHWNIWNYYTLGKLTHYLADAFTYPHNDTFSESLAVHHIYECRLRLLLQDYLHHYVPTAPTPVADLSHTLEHLHRQYLSAHSTPARDVSYILQVTSMLIVSCQPLCGI